MTIGFGTCDAELCRPQKENLPLKQKIIESVYKIRNKYKYKVKVYKHKLLKYIGKTLTHDEVKEESLLGNDINNLNDLLKYSDENDYYENDYPLPVSLNSPSSEKYKYVNSQATSLLCSVARSSFVPIDILNQINKINNVEINMDDVRRALIQNVRTPTNILYDILKAKQGLREIRYFENSIVTHINADERCFEILINSENAETRAVAINRIKNRDMITVCLMDPHPGVKKAAQNRYRELTPKE